MFIMTPEQKMQLEVLTSQSRQAHEKYKWAIEQQPLMVSHWRDILFKANDELIFFMRTLK